MVLEMSTQDTDTVKRNLSIRIPVKILSEAKKLLIIFLDRLPGAYSASDIETTQRTH